MTVCHALLQNCVDYAGLFPPAALDLPTTIRNYLSYRESPDAWALRRLVLPSGRLREFVHDWPDAAAVAPLSVLLGGPEDESGFLSGPGLDVRAYECKVSDASEIEAVLQGLPPGSEVYFEIASDSDPDPLIEALAQARARAKIRTGGATPDAVPPAANVARFLSCCIHHGVPFKATAGLHHPLRGTYPLRYEPGSERGSMHGFLNVLLAAAILREGRSLDDARTVLEDDAPANFVVGTDFLRWRDRSFSAEQIQRIRHEGMISFGSCSFTEPVEELAQLAVAAA